MTRPWHHQFDQAVRGSDLPSAEKLVLFVLNTHADPTGYVPRQYAPSMSRLAAETSLSRRKVGYAVKTCEAAGWLRVHRPSVQLSRTEHATNAYTLVIPDDAASAPDALALVPGVQEAGAPSADKSAHPAQSHSAHPERPQSTPIAADLIDTVRELVGGFREAEEQMAESMLDRGSRPPKVVYTIFARRRDGTS